MGAVLCCLGGTAGDNAPSPATRRKIQAEAAQKRQKALEGRGVKDPEALKRKQKRIEEIENKAEMGPQGDGLRWQVDS